MIDLKRELLPGDLVRYTWTDARTRELCEVTFTLDELAAMQRGEVVARPAPIERENLDEAIAALRARQDQIRAHRDELRRRHPGIDGGDR
jgi:hypothetical protein